ncbi:MULTISPECIES: chromosome condensation regulator RCC1 [Corallococcus]|nr:MULTISPECIES: chromosome condensation regulator RCC1 [Corallococcus]
MRRARLFLMLALCSCGETPRPWEDPVIPSQPPPPDTEAPVVRIDTPAPGQWLNVPRLRLSGDVGDATRVEVWVDDGISRTLSVAGSTLSMELTVPPGSHVLHVSATDAAGNTATQDVPYHGGPGLGGGLSHTGVVRQGRLVTWGGNGQGQLCETTPEERPSPAFALEGQRPIAMVSAMDTTAWISADGSAWLCGALASLLDAGGTVVGSAHRVEGVKDVVGVALGSGHALLLDASGQVWAFGANARGQLGLGEEGEAVPQPTAVPDLTDVVQVVAGSEHSAALHRDGTVSVWGYNRDGVLGTGETEARVQASPARVPRLEQVEHLASGRSHLLALLADGTVRAWGTGTSGQLGHGDAGFGGGRAQPTPVLVLTGVTAVTAANNSSWALGSDGTGWAWGLNSTGQLGVGDTNQRVVPTRLATPLPLVELAAGAQHGLARTRDDAVIIWGGNLSGQLGQGDGAPKSASTPQSVNLP